MEHVRKDIGIKLVTSRERRSLALKRNYHTIRFLENSRVIPMRKTERKRNKSTYLGLSILDINNFLMHQC